LLSTELTEQEMLNVIKQDEGTKLYMRSGQIRRTRQS
jgi:hypothetical protein